MAYVAETFWQERYRNFDIDASGHADLPKAYNRWLYRMKTRKILSAFRRHGAPPAECRVLEYGCGTGVYVDLWRAMGVKALTGFDIAQVSVDTLAPKFPEYRFFKEDLGDPSLPSRHAGPTHHLITAFNVLYHIIDDGAFRQSLRNANALAAPGATFLITDLFVHGPEETHGYMKYRSLANYVAALADAGFEVVERKPVYVTMVKAVDLPTYLGKKFFGALWSRLAPYIGSRPEFMGRLLYAADSVLTAVISEGPSLELLVCRKIKDVPVEAVPPASPV